VVPATVVIGAIWLEGSQGSELYHVSLLLVAPISVATDPRWTLAIACYLTLGYVIGLFGVNSVPWTELERIDDIDAQLEHILAYVPVSLLFIYPLERGASYVARSNQIVQDERARLQRQLKRARLEARATKLGTPHPELATDAAALEVLPPDRGRATDELTAREVEVCQLVAEGLSNNDVAQRLLLSPRTVQSHVANAMTKTHAASRTQLAVLMIRDGLVPAVHPGQETDDSG
jgi:DNA-binding CsgD family transcriptional regulator